MRKKIRRIIYFFFDFFHPNHFLIVTPKYQHRIQNDHCSSFFVPAEGPGAARRGAWEGERGRAPAEGPGGEAPKDFTKPQQTIQSPNRLYKAPKRAYKHSGNIKWKFDEKICSTN